jgi:hypothetical protein
MIALGSKCLLFKTPLGESVPLSSDMISIELSGAAGSMFESEFVDDAAGAVFHYFKYELGRESVTVAEFAEALEKALKSFNSGRQDQLKPRSLVESDLRMLARECGTGCELVFFPRLRSELRELLKNSPQTLKFCGLRDCVKELVGTRRWTAGCRSLKEQILSYLRECLFLEHRQNNCSLVIE